MSLWKTFPAAGCIALLTPYDGGNLGDAAIQEALIANFRKYDPHVQLCGITLGPSTTSALHGIPCFPLAVISCAYYHTDKRPASHNFNDISGSELESAGPSFLGSLKRLVRKLLFSARLGFLVHFTEEILHLINAYRLLRKVDMLVIAGGGQLDEEWGGSWGHPYALMKWALLARCAGSSIVFLSVGGCKIESRLTKVFLRTALSLARYRSYRDEGSRQLALALTPQAEGRVVPDLAFSFPLGNEPLAEQKKDVASVHVGVSPIAFGEPELWPTADDAQFERYIANLSSFVASLLRRGITVTLFSSSAPDEKLFDVLHARINREVSGDVFARLSSRYVTSAPALIDLLRSMDFVVASRLHGLLLAILTGRPSIALSYDRKVDTLMNELGQQAYCLNIRSFTDESLLQSFQYLRDNNSLVSEQLLAACRSSDQILQKQYQYIASLRATASRNVVVADERLCKSKPDLRS